MRPIITASILNYYFSLKKTGYDPLNSLHAHFCYYLQFENPGPDDLCASASASRNNLQFQKVVFRTLSRTKVAFSSHIVEPEV